MRKISKWTFPNAGKLESTDPKLYLQNMTIKEINERLKVNDLVILVLGSLENHGPSCPLGQDTYQCTRMAEIIAEKTGCTLAPPIFYGSHPFHHVGMPGTIVIPEEIFNGQIRAVIAGLCRPAYPAVQSRTPVRTLRNNHFPETGGPESYRCS